MPETAVPTAKGIQVNGQNGSRRQMRLDRICRFSFYILPGAYLVIIFLVYKDYGVTNDEPTQAQYGLRVWMWIASDFQDRGLFV